MRSYGNGRRRMISRAGTNRTVELTLGLCDRATVQRIERWVGKLLCFRDPTGRKMYGVFWAPTINERDDTDAAEITLTAEEVTHSEQV